MLSQTTTAQNLSIPETASNNIFEVFTSGVKILLTKDTIKEGSRSSIKEGSQREIQLHESIRVGKKISYYRLGNNGHKKFPCPASSRVSHITQTGEHTYKIETETSFYIAKRIV